MSSSNGFFINSHDNKRIYVYCWENVDKPKGIVQIFHGMAEHAGRYKDFAEFLNKKGYVVFADDHRGHGKTEDDEKMLGVIGNDGFNKIIEDEYQILKLLIEKYSNLPIFIFGHSFGSFLAQEFLIRYGNELNGVILCGSAAMTGPIVTLGRILTSLQRIFFGEQKKSRLMNTLSFGSYNKRIKNNKSKFAWLSTDENEVKKYEQDRLCGKIFSIGFYYYLFKAFQNLYKKERLSLIPKDIPLLIISGQDDPVGEYGNLVKKLYKIYKDIGLLNVSLKLYPNKRHELLNEVDKKLIFNHIIKWMQEAMK
ncbi:lysophospholipase [Caldicellulosiruptoraceae bacterium PP1]